MPNYSVVYADPPWTYDDKAGAGKRGACFKYSVMALAEIKALPVASLAAKDCALFLWATFPLLPAAFAVIDAWGFAYKTIGFNWVKGSPESGSLFMGMGNWTRSNSEVCLLAVSGNPKRVSASVRSVIIRPKMGHSVKPPEVRDRIVELMGDLPRIELFARQRVKGWDAWGNEVESDVVLGPGNFTAVSGSSTQVPPTPAALPAPCQPSAQPDLGDRAGDMEDALREQSIEEDHARWGHLQAEAEFVAGDLGEGDEDDAAEFPELVGK